MRNCWTNIQMQMSHDLHWSLFVPFGGDQIRMDWIVLVKECITKIEKPKTLFFMDLEIYLV